MNRLTGILQEAYGLVVDDGTLAAAVLGWTVAMWLLRAFTGLPPLWGGLVFFGGLALILLENTTRRARRG